MGKASLVLGALYVAGIFTFPVAETVTVPHIATRAPTFLSLSLTGGP